MGLQRFGHGWETELTALKHVKSIHCFWSFNKHNLICFDTVIVVLFQWKSLLISAIKCLEKTWSDREPVTLWLDVLTMGLTLRAHSVPLTFCLNTVQLSIVMLRWEVPSLHVKPDARVTPRVTQETPSALVIPKPCAHTSCLETSAVGVWGDLGGG